MVKRANIPVLDHGLLSTTFHCLRSKLFRSKERMYGVEGRENKKAEKNEKQRSKEKNRNCSAKKKTTKKKTNPNFGLCACAKVKYCTFLHQIFLKNLLQCKKMHFWQSLEKFSTVAPKKSIKRLKNVFFGVNLTY